MGEGFIHSPWRVAPALVSLIVLSACGNPLRDVDRLSNVDMTVAEAANIAVDPDAEAATGGPGFLGRLLGRSAPDAGMTPPATEATDIADVPADARSATQNGAEDGVELAAANTMQVAPPQERRGLLGLFGGRSGGAADPGAEASDPAVALGPEPATEDGTLADPGLTGDGSPTIAESAAPSPRRSPFDFLRAARVENTPTNATGPDAARVAPGEAVPFGSLATNCDVTRRELGRRVTRQSGFEIWDTDPASTVPRTHYITGFSDNCARQFSGALVIFGDVGTHEIVRYSEVNIDLPWSDVDNAYEDIKRQVCRVNRRQPCGDRLEQLGAQTAFVTVYETFGSAPEWFDILLYDGTVRAAALERP